MVDSPSEKILIVDDEPLFLRTTAELLRKAGYECMTASDGKTALEILARERFDLLLSDLNMPGNLKLELLSEGRQRWPEIPVIVVTGAPSLITAIESVRLGITDYLLKPVKYDDLLGSVRQALRHRTQRLVHDRQTTSASVPEIVGASPSINEVLEIIDRVADTDANILLTGESGSGKEVVARAIHRRSYRANKSFQVVDCTAIPETLFESLLFGHAKGSFTGAVKDQPGLLSEADGGTAFFDEIGELPLLAQAKLLRVIQEQTFTPIGKTTSVTVDTQFICATNRDLEMEINAGRFRRDLFYRLAVIHIQLPPLRERGDDIELLARHFLNQLKRPGHPVNDFSADALDLLRSYTWPGNIRELRNAVEHGLAMAHDDVIRAVDLPPQLRRVKAEARPIGGTEKDAATHAQALGDAEREYLASLLDQNSGNVAQSARDAGLSRQGLHKLLKKHGIDAKRFRP